MERLCLVWDNILPVSISKCFRRTGFKAAISTDASVEHDDDNHEEELVPEWSQITQCLHVQETTFQDFVEVDTDLVTCQ
ncbi:hypothetical protein PR048_005935 [Dryococelus australis]|uniref:Uncharacterized protein n=1 Tax=Dryococelus australis TaxID=614101 RepID=A0ABQ9I9M2_9NEOP|nr:hypothetical protein PR048_005935 [Dryococelus australis]